MSTPETQSDMEPRMVMIDVIEEVQAITTYAITAEEHEKVLDGDLDIYDLIVRKKHISGPEVDWHSIGRTMYVDEDGEVLSED